MKKTSTRYVFPTDDTVSYVFPTHGNDLVMDRSQATASEVFIVLLTPGQEPPLHVHHDTEQIFYVISGHGTLTIGKADDATTHRVVPGDVVRIPPGSPHSIRADGDETLRYLAVDCFPGGRPEAEPTWDAHVQVICKEHGWDYAQVSVNGKK